MKDYNIYADYLILNDKINTKYSSFINEFPLSFKTIEWYLRLYESIGSHEMKRCFYKRKNSFNNFSFYFIRQLFKFYSKTKNRALVNVPRLDHIELDTREFLTNRGIVCKEFGKGFNIIVSLIGNDLFKLGLYNNLKNFPCESNIDKKFWIGFEKSLRKIIKSYSILIKHLNFKIVITQDFHTDTGYIFSEALKLLKIPSIEFAHCWTQDRHLVTLLPINGNYSLIWDKNLLKKIITVCNENESKKLINFGYPNLFKKNIIIRKKHFLLLFPGLQARTNEQRKVLYKKWIKLFDYIKSFKESFKIVIRCHPGDMSSECNEVRNLYKNYISSNTLDYDLSNSFFVIGGATTVLVDSFKAKIPCIQIIDFDPENLIVPIKRFKLENFFQLKLSTVNKLKFLSYDFYNMEFNFKKYFNFLQKQI